MATRRTGARRGRQTRARRAAPRPARDDAAEAGLLALARDLADIAHAKTAGDGRAPALAQAIERLAAAFLPDAPLPRALAAATSRGLASKAALLALAWAREQVRLSLAEILDGARAGGRTRRDVPVETLAWLLLAGVEALAHEPPEARADRVRALSALVGSAPLP